MDELLCQDEFSIKHLLLYHDVPMDFIVSRWQKDRKKPTCWYLLYRWIVGIIFVLSFVFSVLGIFESAKPQGTKWSIYLTHWGFTMCTLQSVIAVFILSVCLACKKLQNCTLKLYRFYWFFHNIATDMAFVITILYWSLMFTPGMRVSMMNFLVHGNNSILMFIDLIVVGHPIRVMHGVYSILFGISYAVFSGVYFYLGGTTELEQNYIYPALDWNKPGETMGVCVGVVMLTTTVHGLCWVIYRFKVWVEPPKSPETD